VDFLRRARQSPLHRIAMHIPQLLHALVSGPHVEVAKASLPEGVCAVHNCECPCFDLACVNTTVGCPAPSTSLRAGSCVVCKGGQRCCLCHVASHAQLRPRRHRLRCCNRLWCPPLRQAQGRLFAKNAKDRAPAVSSPAQGKSKAWATRQIKSLGHSRPTGLRL
jgi:hypothetical protein